jgi:hypothetical protein
MFAHAAVAYCRTRNTHAHLHTRHDSHSHAPTRFARADRIGHGFHLFSHDDLIAQSKSINDMAAAKQYIDNLVRYIADRRITIEVRLLVLSIA